MLFVSLAPRAKAKCMSGRCPTTGTSLFFFFFPNEGNLRDERLSSLNDLTVRDSGSLRMEQQINVLVSRCYRAIINIYIYIKNKKHPVDHPPKA